MIAGFVASMMIYLAFLVVLCVCDVDTIMAISDAIVRWAVKRTTIESIARNEEGSIIANIHVDYRFGANIVTGAWLGTLRAAMYLRGL